MTSRLETYRVEAYNTSKLSENKIHDDAVARRFGFCGGLVPGVDVMAYMMHVPVAKWGRAFLERGLIEARFVKPVYDGEIAEVNAALESSPGLINSDPYGDGWVARLRPADWGAEAGDLASGPEGVEAYRRFLDAEGIACGG